MCVFMCHFPAISIEIAVHKLCAHSWVYSSLHKKCHILGMSVHMLLIAIFIKSVVYVCIHTLLLSLLYRKCLIQGVHVNICHFIVICIEWAVYTPVHMSLYSHLYRKCCVQGICVCSRVTLQRSILTAIHIETVDNTYARAPTHVNKDLHT